MKYTFVTIITLIMTVLSLNAQTNNVSTNLTAFDTSSGLSALSDDTSSGKESGGWELTLGGSGETVNGESVFGADFTLSTNPFKFRPEVWVGISQGLYWEPTFAGSTDLFVDWSQNLWNDKLYANVGWSGGAVYQSSGSETVWRTGPELTLQFYTSDYSFIFAGVNFDVYQSNDENNNWRYSFGIGLTW